LLAGIRLTPVARRWKAVSNSSRALANDELEQKRVLFEWMLSYPTLTLRLLPGAGQRRAEAKTGFVRKDFVLPMYITLTVCTLTTGRWPTMSWSKNGFCSKGFCPTHLYVTMSLICR
jgi:hypothetical protein